MSADPPRTKAQRWRERLYAAIAISMLLVLGACSGMITILELPLRLAVGWVWHLGKTAPSLIPKWHGLLLPLGCLALGTWLVHRFIRWWISAKGSRMEWRAAHTLSATALVLAGAAAAIALSGVVHQAVWLSDAKWWASNHDYTRAAATSNIRQLQFAIMGFQDAHGRYPELLAELQAPQKVQHVAPESGKPPESIVYLKPDESHPRAEAAIDDDTVILVSPLLGPEREWAVIGLISGKTVRIHRGQLTEILETRRIPSRTGP